MRASEENSALVGKAAICGAIAGAIAGAMTAMLARKRWGIYSERMSLAPPGEMGRSFAMSAGGGESSGSAGGGMTGGAP